MDTPVFHCPVPEDNVALNTQWQLLDAAFDRAEILGVRTLRIFSFLDPEPSQGVQRRVAELLTEAAQRASHRNLRLAVATTSSDAARLLNEVIHPALGVSWTIPGTHEMPDPARIFHVILRTSESDGMNEIQALLDRGYQDSFALHSIAVRTNRRTGPDVKL